MSRRVLGSSATAVVTVVPLTPSIVGLLSVLFIHLFLLYVLRIYFSYRHSRNLAAIQHMFPSHVVRGNRSVCFPKVNLKNPKKKYSRTQQSVTSSVKQPKCEHLQRLQRLQVWVNVRAGSLDTVVKRTMSQKGLKSWLTRWYMLFPPPIFISLG